MAAQLAALVAAVQAGEIGGAGLDVFDQEPLPKGDPLWSTPNIIVTPHASGHSRLRAGRMEDLTVDNLARLRTAGATVLYGTDFGNTRTAGIDETELALLANAGLSADDLRIAATRAPAEFWGFDELGRVDVGKRAALWVGDCSCLFCP